jgi:hypothetical protein
MNNARRKAIAKAVSTLTEVKEALEKDLEGTAPAIPETTQASLTVAHTGLIDARDEEQDYLDNMIEAFANGDKGDKAQEDIDFLDNAATYTQEAIDALAATPVDVEALVAKIEEAIDEAEQVS